MIIHIIKQSKTNNSPRGAITFIKNRQGFTRSIITMLSLACCCFAHLSCKTAVAESATFIVNNTDTVLELSIPNSVDLNLNPTSESAFGEADLVVSAGTNNPTGYILTMSVPNRNLTNTDIIMTSNPNNIALDDSNHPIITNLAAGSYSETTFINNSWGYRLTGVSYLPIPSILEIANTKSASNASPITVKLAAKVDTTRPSGAYSTTINFAAVTNPLPPTMQEFAAGIATTNCADMNIGSNITLTDSRDGMYYLVGKLSDGKCWMLDNLALDIVTYKNSITAANTNASDTVLGYLKNGGGTGRYPATGVQAITPNGGGWANSFSTPYIATGKDGTNYVTETVTSYGAGSGRVGVYYNYCAASAGNYCYADSAGVDDPDGDSTLQDTNYDICPKGWRMPTGGDTGEYQALLTDYNNNQIAADSGSLQYNLSTPESGMLRDGLAGGQNVNGYLWSSTYYNAGQMYFLYINSSYVDPSAIDTRKDGFPIRCLFRPTM